MREVQRYLDTPDAQTMSVIDPGIRQRLLRHLENCVSEIDTDISPTIAPAPSQEPMFQEVITDKRISLSAIPKCEPNTIPTLSAEVLFNRMEVEPTEQDKKARLEPDSSTAEEINNNAETNFRNENEISRIEQEVVATQHPLPNNVIKMYDGNFVFVLPSHYIQLAAALGINLSQQTNVIPVTETNTIQDAQIRPQAEIRNVVQPENPIDFSKNNDVNDMWRPW